MKPISAEQAERWAESLCSRAEYASGEVRQKLLAKGLTSTVAERIIENLRKNRFIDDARFAHAFARNKVEYGRWGRKKIASALMTKKVDRDIIRDALDDIDPDTYIQAIEGLLEAKLRSMHIDVHSLDYAAKAKLYRLAISRGFETSAITSALDSLKNNTL